MGDPRAPSEAEVLDFFRTLSNWGRWGDDDQLGTLNLVTPDKRVAAAGLVREGESISCAWEIDPRPSVDQVFGSPQRFMLSTGQGLADAERVLPPGAESAPRWGGASEFVGLVFHGYSVTHLDALSHYFWDGKMYNGVPAARVTSAQGATHHAMAALPDGVMTRGVLLDVARARGVDWLEPGDGVFPDDLDAAERAQGVRVGSGDAVLLRTGYGRKKRERGADDVRALGRAGWHVACTPWLRERDVALIGADTAQDVHPSGYPGLRSPVHAVGIVAMGLWLLDNCDLERLAARCEGLRRWEFAFQLAPLRITGATGSPVNPIALL
jgi:kynurenine formamidase